MARSERQKLKLLYLAKYFLEQTDETHPVTVAKLIAALNVHEIQAERKSIYDDIAALQAFGMDIVQLRGRNGGYFLASRTFELPELKLLADAVQSSRFLTEKKSLALIRKIESLTSVHAAKTLQRQVVVLGRVKTMNESIYYNVDELHAAIAADRTVTFRYFEYAPTKQQVFRRNGARYEISPFALTWDDQNYYLIGYDAPAGILKHFRVDKMQELTMTETPRSGHAIFDARDRSRYETQLFDMFSGEAQTVRLVFENHLAGAVIDRFGKDISLIAADENHFTVSVSVAVSPRFFGWLAGFGTGVRIDAPAAVRDQMRIHIAQILALYDEDQEKTVAGS